VTPTSFTAHRFSHRLNSCSVTSIPSPASAVAVKSVSPILSGSNHLHSARGLRPQPCSPSNYSSVDQEWCGSRTSSQYHRVRHQSLSVGCVFTRFAFHTPPRSRHREIQERRLSFCVVHARGDCGWSFGHVLKVYIRRILPFGACSLN
jgi:hypothetical protein